MAGVAGLVCGGLYHIRARDQWIGWDDNQRRARLRLVANNARFCLLTGPGEFPNLASRAMALNLARLSEDWRQAYGHPILMAESFVDTQLFRGTAYKASGWKAVGLSSGFKRVAENFYVAHDRPKQLYVREMVKHAARQLRQRQLPEGLREHEQRVDPSCQMPKEELSSFWQAMHRQVPDSRNVHGLRHKQATVLTITFAFLLSGGQGGHRSVATFARDLTPTQPAAVRCWFIGPHFGNLRQACRCFSLIVSLRPETPSAPPSRPLFANLSTMNPFQPPGSQYLCAASVWLVLGNRREANEELGKISSQLGGSDSGDVGSIPTRKE